jgi:hypothetical protein
VKIVPKKRRMPIWLIPIIAIVGVIGYVTSALGKPKTDTKKTTAAHQENIQPHL